MENFPGPKQGSDNESASDKKQSGNEKHNWFKKAAVVAGFVAGSVVSQQAGAQNTAEGNSVGHKAKIEALYKIFEDDKGDFLDSLSTVASEKVKDPQLAGLVAEAAKEAPWAFVNNIRAVSAIEGIDIKKEIENAAAAVPGVVLRRTADIKSLRLFFDSEWNNLVEHTIDNHIDVLSEEDYAPILDSFPNPKSEIIKALKKIKEAGAERTLLSSVIEKNLTVEQIKQIESDNLALLKEYMFVASRPNGHFADQAVGGIEGRAVTFVDHMNQLHDKPDIERFKQLEQCGAEELYEMISFGGNQMFTSTFNGTFNRMLEKMKSQNLTGQALVEHGGKWRYTTFLKTCTAFSRINEFLETMDTDNARESVLGLIKNIENLHDDFEGYAAVFADMIGMVKDQTLIDSMGNTIVSEYERVSHDSTVEESYKNLYKILAGIYIKATDKENPSLRQLANGVVLEESARAPEKALFNPNGVDVQRYFFYDDIDGQVSFDSFLKEYENQPEWKIIKESSYVLVKSVQGDRAIEIYANYPKSENEGLKNIDAALKSKKLEINVTVHRGHSYHVEGTLSNLPKSSTIVSLGSCGGYQYLRRVLEKIPDANVFFTRGTGTRAINDPLFKKLNETILEKGEVDFESFWQEAQQELRGDKNFENYIPPHKNLSTIFFKTYEKYLKQAPQRTTAHYTEGFLPNSS
ncbi:MAG: hypothetical protein WDN09_02875 [bacterium]